MDVQSRKTNCGRKKLQLDMNQVVRVPLRKRGTIRSIAQALKIPKSTLFNYMHCGEIRRHSATFKYGKTAFNTSQHG